MAAATRARPDLGPLTTAAPGEYVALRRLDGTTVRSSSTPRFPGGTAPPPPALPAHITLPASSHSGERVSYFTVAAKSGDARYRVRASIEPQNANYVLVVAQPSERRRQHAAPAALDRGARDGARPRGHPHSGSGSCGSG